MVKGKIMIQLNISVLLTSKHCGLGGSFPHHPGSNHPRHSWLMGLENQLIKAMLGLLPHAGKFSSIKDLSQVLQQVATSNREIRIDFHFPITVRGVHLTRSYPHLSIFQEKKQKISFQKVENAWNLPMLLDLADRQSVTFRRAIQRVLMLRCLVQADVIFWMSTL